MMNDASFLLGALLIYVLIRLVSEFHYRLTPKLDKSKVGDIVKFIAQKKNISLNALTPLPEIYIVRIEDLKLPDSVWKMNNGVVDFIIEGYFPEWRRVLLVDGCRQNILVHALTHYIQFEYEPDLLSEKDKETEAWAITKQYLKYAHPLNYWILTIPFGIYCWWTSTPY